MSIEEKLMEQSILKAKKLAGELAEQTVRACTRYLARRGIECSEYRATCLLLDGLHVNRTGIFHEEGIALLANGLCKDAMAKLIELSVARKGA